MPLPLRNGRFDEYALRDEIYTQWGLYGAHADVYNTLLREMDALRAMLLMVETKLGNLPQSRVIVEIRDDIRHKLGPRRDSERRYD